MSSYKGIFTYDINNQEPEVYWYVNGNAEVGLMRTDWEDSETTEACKQIGNYFETKEEAEKALERLRAWKRLKDKKIFIYLDHFDCRSQDGSFNVEFGDNLSSDELNQVNDDLDLIFGGD